MTDTVNQPAHYTAWAPGRVWLLSYWGESADAAKEACTRHAEGREHEIG